MKRSLVMWPLTASLFVTGLSWLGMQADPGARMIVSGAVSLWKTSGLARTILPPTIRPPAIQPDVPRVSATAAGLSSGRMASTGQAAARTTASPARGAVADAWAELSQIESWSDASFELQQPSIAGIPAPSLDSYSDIFGFDADFDDASGGASSGDLPVLELAPPAEHRVSVELDVAKVASPDAMVIRIDPDVFFADERPLSQGQPHVRLDDTTPRMAERPTYDVALPSAFEAPAATVADLAPDRNQIEATPGEPATDLLGAEEKSVTPAATPGKNDSSPDAQAPPEVSEVTRQKESDAEDVGSTRKLTQPRSAAWPVPHRLIEQLDILESIVIRTDLPADDFDLDPATTPVSTIGHHELLEWSKQVRDLLSRLHQANRLGQRDVEPLLHELKHLEQFASVEAESLRSRSRRVAWLQAAYSIERRLAVWEPIFKINSGNFPAVQHVGDDLPSVADAIDRLESRLVVTGDAAGWSKFLLLESVRDAFESGDDNARREVAQKFLSRLTWPNLAAPHQRFLADPTVNDVAVAIKPWASGAIDYSALLHQIERAESNAIDLVTAEIAQSMQALGHANHPQAQQLSANLDTHYRNANVRFSLSEELLRDLMPQLPTREVPLRTTMLGSRVTGISRVSTDLRLRLIPSPSTWELTLETIGNVSTRSVGRSGPAAIKTTSVNPYTAATPISIKPDDIFLGDPSVNVGGRSRLRGINTTYDAWPLVGTLVQSIAETQYFEKASLADRIGRNRIRSQIGDEIDRSVTEKVDQATAKFSETILGPLNRLQLEPRVIDMSSTSSRLMARYRMAGDWQLAAMTPRPRALSDNLFSVQLHQSAINNTLEQLVPQDETLPIDQVLTQCFDVLGASDRPLPDDLPEDIMIQFAKHRPITVEIEDGKVWITMRIIRLQGDRVRLRNFIVRAAYTAQIDGLNAALVRHGHLSISGPGMSMRQRFPVRAIFNKVLSPTRPLQLTSPELLAERLPEQSGITQFELRDGWVGISIGKTTEHQRVASRPAGIR
ncbi:hypothetical protein NZK35_30890 [Stieleria sp. ICT_E10.1]|uniref:hypothetical protein n=1 Tax=Stieleria sedimenti TaxID=2976331 RepID=UPI00217FA79D|nr:hypothetical protein [Stieleria sedimenti]MCS7471085.1 hypothetical protein [Stieleria sedimenti]